MCIKTVVVKIKTRVLRKLFESGLVWLEQRKKKGKTREIAIALPSFALARSFLVGKKWKSVWQTGRVALLKKPLYKR